MMCDIRLLMCTLGVHNTHTDDDSDNDSNDSVKNSNDRRANNMWANVWTMNS